MISYYTWFIFEYPTIVDKCNQPSNLWNSEEGAKTPKFRLTWSGSAY